MRPIYFLLPFIKPLFMNETIIYKKSVIQQNESIFDTFNILEPNVQQFMLQF
jgi:hypothetical protein